MRLKHEIFIPNLQQTLGTFARIPRKLQLVKGLGYVVGSSWKDPWVYIWIGLRNSNGVHFSRQKMVSNKKWFSWFWRGTSFRNPFQGESLHTLPKTNSKSPLKMDSWKTILSFWGRTYIFQGFLLSVLGSESGSFPSRPEQLGGSSQFHWEKTENTTVDDVDGSNIRLTTSWSGEATSVYRVFSAHIRWLAGFLKNQ